jgi:solute carrier family 38 (sodium-coupled neutral amino acid transporter), member 2
MYTHTHTPTLRARTQIAVLANCAVMNVVFVVVLGDILLGSAPNYAGVLPEAVRAAAAAGWLPPGVPTSPSDPWGWLLGRPAVLGVVSLCILLPLSLARSMSALAPVNIIGVASNAGFAALLLSLAGAAVAAGTAAPLDLLPDWAALLPAGTSGSSGGAAGVAAAAVALAGVAPVLLNVDVCHQSLHPLMPLLQPYSPRRMRRLVATALALCNLVYLAIGLSAWAVFGELLDPDVLSNVNSAAFAPMIDAGAAAAAAGAVRVGYLASIVGSFVLLTHPLRQCIGDLLLGGQRAVAAHWQVMTLVLVGGAYAVGCFVPTIWSALALVGATTSTVQAFIVPGLVVLAAQRPRRGRSSGSSSAEPLLLSAALPGSGVSRGPAAKAGAMLVIALGVALFINSVVDALRGGAASSGGRAAAASGADGGAIGGVSGADLLWATLGLAR